MTRASTLGASACSACFFIANVVVARPDGFAASCGGCHYGQQTDQIANPKPKVTASAERDQLAPDETIELSVTVERTWDAARVAGFLILGDASTEVTVLDPDTHHVGQVPNQTQLNAVGHLRAKELVDGKASFRASWTAPATAGSYDFKVYGVTSDDGDGQDDNGATEEVNDPFGETLVTVGVGCELSTYYQDADADGYGALPRRSCAPLAGYVDKAGDCDDERIDINPEAPELCSAADENCDGEAMKPLVLYADLDGDGFGALKDGLNATSCEPVAGFSLEGGDCAPGDAAVYPGAPEVPNGRDDNCDGKSDDAGAGGAPPVTGAGGGPQAGAPAMEPAMDGAESGCSVAGGGASTNGLAVASWIGLLLVAGATLRARSPIAP